MEFKSIEFKAHGNFEKMRVEAAADPTTNS